jgi:hypothetical protein
VRFAVAEKALCIFGGSIRDSIDLEARVPECFERVNKSRTCIELLEFCKDSLCLVLGEGGLSGDGGILGSWIEGDGERSLQRSSKDLADGRVLVAQRKIGKVSLCCVELMYDAQVQLSSDSRTLSPCLTYPADHNMR